MSTYHRLSRWGLAIVVAVTGCSSNSDGAASQATGGADATSVGGNGGMGNYSGGTTSATGGSPAACTWGDQTEQSTPYGQGTILRICPVSIESRTQRYEFTIPSSPASGGYVIFNYRNVSLDILLESKMTPAGESTLSPSVKSSGIGKDADAWLAAAAGAHFYLDIADLYVHEIPYPPCTLTAAYIPVPDTYEPNSQSTNATPISVGTPLVAYAFSGAESGTGGSSDIQFDAYQVALAAGTATVSVTNAPTDMRLGVMITGALVGASYVSGTTSTDTQSLQLTPSLASAGTFNITISPSFSIFAHTGSGTVLPNWVTQPYTLLVTQP
jgi:hypothetical protein